MVGGALQRDVRHTGSNTMPRDLDPERTRSRKPAISRIVRLWGFILESLESLRDDDQEVARKNRELLLRQKRWLDYLSRS